jgi:hypothetical protein
MGISRNNVFKRIYSNMRLGVVVDFFFRLELQSAEPYYTQHAHYSGSFSVSISS